MLMLERVFLMDKCRTSPVRSKLSLSALWHVGKQIFFQETIFFLGIKVQLLRVCTERLKKGESLPVVTAIVHHGSI